MSINQNSNCSDKYFWSLLAMAAFILWFRLGATPIYILDEAKNAQCAREMFLKNDWVVPTFNGNLRTDKPILHYWFMMMAYSAFGVHEWSARFFATFMGLGTIFIAWYFTKKRAGNFAAFFTALVLCCSTQFLFEFRLAVPDPFLIFFTTLGLFCLYEYLQTEKWKWILSSAIALALACLAKGPVALALPGLVVVLFCWVNKCWGKIFSLKIPVATIVFFAIALPWYLAVHKATNGAFTKGFFLEHNLNRFSGEMEGHGGPFFITPIIVFIGMLPLSVFIFSFIKKKMGMRQQPFILFAAIVALVYIVFFSISKTKLPNYPMPCYTFVAILLGQVLQRFFVEKKPWPVYVFFTLFLVTSALPIAGYFALKNEPATVGMENIALWLSVLPLGILLLSIYRKKWIGIKIALRIVLLYAVFNILFIDILYPKIYQKNPVTLSIQEIKKEESVAAFQGYNPAYNFYLPKNIPVFQDSASLINWCKGHQCVVLTQLGQLNLLNNSIFFVKMQLQDLFENEVSILLKKVAE